MMTETILNSIENIYDLALFSKAYKKGTLKVNITKLANELNKDRKIVRKYLNGDTPSSTRTRIKYLDQYRDVIITLLKDQ